MSAEITSNIKTEKRVIILLLILPNIFFFLHNLAEFMERILTDEVLYLFIAYSIVSIFLFIIIKSVFRQTSLFAAIFSNLIITVFLFFGILQDFLLRFKQFGFLSNTFFLLISAITLLFIISYFIRKNKKRMKPTSRYLLMLFSVLISYESILIAYKTATGKTIAAITDRMISPVKIETDSIAEKPDIYYIVFDGYTGPASLKEYWGFENDIYPYLNSRGFYTIDSAFSNYKSTPFSISSVLNLQYLTGSEPYLYSNSSNFLIGQQVYKKNILFSFLKKQQYDFSIFSQLENKKMLTAFGFLGVEKPVNWLRKLTIERIYLDPWKLNKLKSLFSLGSAQQTVKLESMMKFDGYNKKAIDHIFSDCDKSSEGKLSKPVFSYTHFMLPHDPYLRDESGNLVDSPQPGGMNMNGYLRQIKYSNLLIKKITDCLLSDTSRKKIIIIQGDHGYRHNPDAPENRQFEALNAIYFYNQDYKGLRKNMSHVNTFRVVLNNIFGSHLLLLDDKSFVLKSE